VEGSKGSKHPEEDDDDGHDLKLAPSEDEQEQLREDNANMTVEMLYEGERARAAPLISTTVTCMRLS
jgi:hypothetical protein